VHQVSEMTAFNLLDQLVFYGSYHHNKWNKLIHVFFVPLIMWTAMVWFCYLDFGVDLAAKTGLSSILPVWVSRRVVLNAAFVLMLGYGLYYISLEPVAGATMACVLFSLYLTAHAFLESQGREKAWQYALALHVLGWYMQIHPGHALLEGRKPALTDSFFQSLVLAPLFVWMEILFTFGYRRSLEQEMEKRVMANILAYQAQKKAKTP